MRPLFASLLLALASASACRPAPAAPAIPPAAASEPLSVSFDEDDEFDVPAPAPRPECEAPPATSVASPDFGRVREEIAEVLRWTGTPSIAVAVARGETILWEEGFGFADPRRRVKADQHTMYSLASVSKPMTATAIMLLRERGQLELDQPLDELLPAPGLHPGVGDPQQVTVRRVASHTSGLPLHWQFYYEGAATVPPLAQTRERYAVTVAEPGERYQYSNLGFGLLGQVVEHRGGKPFVTFMREEVFEPLGMRHTFAARPPRGAGTEAVRFDGRGKAIANYGFDHDGASGMYSSAHDLVRFGMFHLGTAGPEASALLPEAARAEMRVVVPPAESYGLGFGVSRQDGMQRVSHSGGMPGVRTLLVMYPEQQVVIVVLANSSAIEGAHKDVADSITHALGLPARADDLCKLPLGHALFGTWQGEVASIAGPRPIALTVRPTGEVELQLGDGPPTTVRDVKLRDGRLTGSAWGDVGAEQGKGRPTALVLDLRVHDESLEGGVTAIVPWVAATTLLTTLLHAPP